jgi:hypothetical protein
MKLILDTLERARLAASPAEALDVADALTDLEALADALARNGWTLDEAPGALDELALIRAHVALRPFDVLDTGDDKADAVTLDETTPGAFADWLADLDRLAS